jgi:hypothetical protein
MPGYHEDWVDQSGPVCISEDLLFETTRVGCPSLILPRKLAQTILE